MDKRDNIHSISGFESFNLNPGKKFCKMNDELLLVCGTNNLFLVDIKAYQLINTIECDNIITLYKISDKYVLSGHDNGLIKQWECNGRDTKLFSYKSSAHASNYVTTIFKIDDLIISGDSSGYIKLWN